MNARGICGAVTNRVLLRTTNFIKTGMAKSREREKKKKPVLTYPGLMLARKVDTSSDSSMFACFGTFVDSDAGRKGEAEIGPGRFLALCSGMAENRGEYNCEKEMQSSA